MPRRTHTTSFDLDLGARIRELRHEMGMSLSQVAQVTGISKGHLSSIELGFAAITVESLAKIANGLDVHPLVLLAFPKKDEFVAVVEVARQLPMTRLKKLRKLIKQWIQEVEEEEH